MATVELQEQHPTRNLSSDIGDLGDLATLACVARECPPAVKPVSRGFLEPVPSRSGLRAAVEAA